MTSKKFTKPEISNSLIEELKSFGECAWGKPSLKYESFLLTEEKAQQLEQILSADLEGKFDSDDEDNSLCWVPVHAWRILAAKKYGTAIPTLIERLVANDDNDDFSHQDLINALSQFGAAVVDSIIKEFKNDVPSIRHVYLPEIIEHN